MSLIADVINDLTKLYHGPRVMRKFGLLLGALLLVFGGIVCLKHRLDPSCITHSVIGFWAIGGFTILLALIAPPTLTPVNTGMVFIAMISGWIMTRVILTLVFYLLFTPSGFIMKCVSHRYLAYKNPTRCSELLASYALRTI